MNYWEILPGHERWTWTFIRRPRNHWLLPYIIEKTDVRFAPDQYKIDRLG